MISGQLLDCVNVLKELVDTRKYVQRMQSKIISEEHIRKLRLRSKENEHVPNVLDYNEVIIESKEKKEDNWIKLKHMLIDYFYKKNITMQ